MFPDGYGDVSCLFCGQVVLSKADMLRLEKAIAWRDSLGPRGGTRRDADQR